MTTTILPLIPGPEVYDGIEALGLPDDCRGWHSNHPVFAELIGTLRARFNVDLIVEVGSWKGASAIHMAGVRRALGGSFRLVCVDTWLGSLEHWTQGHRPGFEIPRRFGYPQLYHQFLHNVKSAGFTAEISPVPLPSTIGAALLAEQGIRPQLIYLDGSHQAADVRADLAAWWPLLAPGGIMFGDDIQLTGVRPAVLEFAARETCLFEIRDSQFWIIHKPGSAR